MNTDIHRMDEQNPGEIARLPFSCPRCGFATTKRYNLKNHYHRKHPCVSTLEDVPISDLRKSMETQHPEPTVIEGRRVYPCEHCKKVFSCPQGRYQHRRSCKGVLDPIVSLQEQIKSLRQEIQSVRQSGGSGGGDGASTSTSIGTQNNVTTIHNHVTIHAYDRPSLDHLNPAFLTQCIKRRDKGVCELIEQIHFNAALPQNHSLRIPNRRSNWIETHNGERFELQDKNKVLDELIRQGFEILDEHYNLYESDIEYALNYNPTRLEEIRKFLEGCRENDISVITPLKKDMFLLILNKQYILFQKRTGNASS